MYNEVGYTYLFSLLIVLALSGFVVANRLCKAVRRKQSESAAVMSTGVALAE